VGARGRRRWCGLSAYVGSRTRYVGFLLAVRSFVPELLDVLAVHLSQGTMVFTVNILDMTRIKCLLSHFLHLGQLVPGQTVAALLPQNASTVVDADGEEIVPIEQP